MDFRTAMATIAEATPLLSLHTAMTLADAFVDASQPITMESIARSKSVRVFIQADQKIKAIKECREQAKNAGLDYGLKAAKEAVEAVWSDYTTSPFSVPFPTIDTTRTF